jgi:Fe-S-cluster-containing hydrogenase component 2
MGCDKVCLNCVDVCPNRANETVWLDGRPQIVHIDGRCNECGNCGTFCPYESLPYRDKLTFFASEADFRQSENPGWAMLDGGRALCAGWPRNDRRPLRPRAAQGRAALMRATLAQMPWLARA